jgi:tRNA/rRNA methyltransferase
VRLLSNHRVVLHQIRSPDNLGAIARLVANFQVGALALSDPATHAFSAARKLAVGAEEILDQMRVAHSLREALEPVSYACATTSRAVQGRASLSPEEAVERLARRAEKGPVALVFGGEKRGLSDEEIALCQDVLVIPTSSEQPSMNVAQSAAILLYLCSRSARPAAQETEATAPLRELSALEEKMGQVLGAAGFLNSQAPHHILRELMRTLERSALSTREAHLWLSAFDRLRLQRPAQ